MSSENEFEAVVNKLQSSARNILDSVREDTNKVNKFLKVTTTHEFSKDQLRGRVNTALQADADALSHLEKYDKNFKGKISDNTRETVYLRSGNIRHDSIEVYQGVEDRRRTFLEKAGFLGGKVKSLPTSLKDVKDLLPDK
jgi:hypothetical protein